MKAEIRALSYWPWSGRTNYDFGLKAKHTSLNGLQITFPPALQLMIGDDMGKANLGTGNAVFGKINGQLPWFLKDKYPY